VKGTISSDIVGEKKVLSHLRHCILFAAMSYAFHDIKYFSCLLFLANCGRNKKDRNKETCGNKK
jgi:hypothetical protein